MKNKYKNNPTKNAENISEIYNTFYFWTYIIIKVV